MAQRKLQAIWGLMVTLLLIGLTACAAPLPSPSATVRVRL